MNTYLQRVANNILPLSISDHLPDAFKEWYFTDSIEDHETTNETCQLCEKEELRYHFEIKNKLTNQSLWVGSSCILKFQIPVFDNGQLLDKTSSQKKLNKLREKMRLDSCIRALQDVAQKEGNDILTNALNYYEKNNYLTPKFAFVVLWRLSENNIDHNPSFFKINLKKKKYKQDLAKMSAYQFNKIWFALTPSQRKLAERLGHQKPY